jgi:Protein of unknown function (DUF3435)
MHLTGTPRTIYIFHERDDHLALCPISYLIALALVDEAFEAVGDPVCRRHLPI